MSTFPHVYTTSAQGESAGELRLTAEGLPAIDVTAPVEFGGPEGYWNPEAFFSASISTCFILTFRFASRLAKVSWKHIMVDVDAYLDKNGQTLSFNKVDIFVTLTLNSGEDQEAALKALEKSKDTCLITNSINAEIELHPKIVF